jgi:hypothetical protein
MTEEIVRKAFNALEFAPQADTCTIFGLNFQVSSSVDPLIGHGLNRLHSWLWPLLSKMEPGETLKFNDSVFRYSQDKPAAGREWAQKVCSFETNQRNWKLVWQDIGGQDANFSVGLTEAAMFSVAYCDFPEGLAGPVRGYLTGKGKEVRDVFDLLDLAAREMPVELLNVRKGTIKSPWELEPLLPFIEFDGRIGATLAPDLYDMAQQHAASLIAKAALSASVAVPDILTKHNILFPQSVLEVESQAICGLALQNSDVRGYYTQLARCTSECDRYLSWSEIGPDGGVLKLNIHAVPADERATPIIQALLQGDELQPSVSYDCSTGVSTFNDPVKGYDHLANYAILAKEHDELLSRIEPLLSGNEFPRIIEFEELEPRDTPSLKKKGL